MLLRANIYATHIVGGSFSLRWISGNQYELTMKVLRDCINGRADFDQPASVAVFDKVTHQMKASYSMNLIGPAQQLNFFGPNCSDLPNTCTEVGTYRTNITLSPSIFNNNAGYYFAYERCCRNNIIQNIVAPQDASITLYMEIPPPQFIKNSTPYFTNNPNTFLCVNNNFTYNLKYKDDDGDSLVYSLVTPINGFANKDQPQPPLPASGPYPNITWQTGYSNINAIQGNPPLTINAKTGEITVNPTTPGVHVAAIRVEEYRFGKKLGEVRLELQFLVTTCKVNPMPEIRLADEFGKPVPFNSEIEIPGQLCFDIISTDPEDSLEMSISGSWLDSNIAYMPKVVSKTTKGLKEVRTRFCWQTSCTLDGITKTFNINVKDNGCPIPKTNTASFTIKIKPMPLVYSTDLLCMFFQNNTSTRVYFGDTASKNPYFSHYAFYRAIGSGPFEKIDSLYAPFSESYLDANTPNYRNINYRYMMRAVNKCGKEGITSDTLGTLEQLIAEPQQQRLITVTVEDNKRLKIVWPQTPEKDFAMYYLYKSKKGDTAFKLLQAFNSITDTFYTDEDVKVQEDSYCYYLMMRDTCDNLSETGKLACSILLKGNSHPFEHNLEWTPFNYWANGTKVYEILRQDQQNPFMILYTKPSSQQSIIDDKLNRKSGIYQYAIVAQEEQGDAGPFFGASSLSNEITLTQSPLLHVPNAFTANRDGMNDEWGIRDVFVKDYHLRVYNRWGQLVFETKDKDVQWKGESDNSYINQTDVYVYLVTYTGWDGSSNTLRGNVTVIR
ncbi:MAG: gliding motility-associated C-terminal domain-containing protein [Bacteroidota bacterium]